MKWDQWRFALNAIKKTPGARPMRLSRTSYIPKWGSFEVHIFVLASCEGGFNFVRVLFSMFVSLLVLEPFLDVLRDYEIWATLFKRLIILSFYMHFGEIVKRSARWADWHSCWIYSVLRVAWFF